MRDTSARLLTLLSLLQTPREWPGGELAERLGVTRRTVRRDIDRLRELGYPVEASQGTYGGYRLAAGKAMPPLLLDDDEAVAIAVGMRAAAGSAVSGIEEAAVRALAKLEQVLPSRLRHRVGSLAAGTESMTAWTPADVDAEHLTVLAGAATNTERVRFGYRSADLSTSRRHVEPYRLVASQRRWYLVAYDLDRDGWRTFRVDRIADPQATGGRAQSREFPAEDAATFVLERMSSLASSSRAEVTVHAPIGEVAARLGDSGGDLQPVDERSCRLTLDTDTLEWLAVRLAMIGCEFEVHEPPELRAYLAEAGGRMSRAGRIKNS